MTEATDASSPQRRFKKAKRCLHIKVPEKGICGDDKKVPIIPVYVTSEAQLSTKHVTSNHQTIQVQCYREEMKMF